MSKSIPDPESFYSELLPRQWNNDRRAAADVNTTIRVEVGEQGKPIFFLNITEGHLYTESSPKYPILVSIYQDTRAFEYITRDSAGSPLSFLGAISGFNTELNLTRRRVTALEQLAGTLDFVVTGEDGFKISFDFREGETHAQIQIDPKVYQQLSVGELDLQRAFFDGLLSVEGDLDLAMRAALAAFAPG